MKLNQNIKCNPAQRRAIEHDKGPACVIAGPGSGKTFVIIQRIISLIRKGVSPGSILTITFTKAAAIEMQQRFIKETDSLYPEVLFGTFHSIFYHILGSDKLSILKETDKYKILSHVLYGRDYDSETIRLLLSEFSRLKNIGEEPENRSNSVPFFDSFPEIYRNYHEILREQGLIDFDDMVLLCRDYLLKRPDERKKWQERLCYIQIDEYQDINRMQFEVIRLLLNGEQNIFVVGDDDQSIYGFRGSDPKLMLGFKEHFPGSEEIILDTNYRCAPVILNASKCVIEENRIRFKKDIKSGKQEIKGIVKGIAFPDRSMEYKLMSDIIKRYTGISRDDKRNANEVIRVNPADIAIIVRTNIEATSIARMLTEAEIPCSYKEKIVTLQEKPVIKDMLSYMAFSREGQRRSDFLRIMNKPVRYISRESCEGEIISESSLLSFYAKRGRLSMTTTVQKLFRDIKMLSKLRPKAAVHFVRGYMGYDKYLKERYQGNEKALKLHLDDLNEFEKLCQGFKDYNELKDYLDDTEKTIEKLKQVTTHKNKGVRIMTMHASKGLEFKYVCLPDLNEGIVPSRKSVTNEELEEERRMLYVAMTRAKEGLFLGYVKGTKDNPMRMSGFLRPVRDLFTDYPAWDRI